MQGARFPRNEAYLEVRRSDEKIEATPQMRYFQRNQNWYHLTSSIKVVVFTRIGAYSSAGSSRNSPTELGTWL